MKTRIYILFFLLSFKFSFAGFTLAGTVITQSGTDTNLDGLSAISGVTVTTITGIYSIKIYTLTNRKLRITGNLTLTSKEKLIFTGQAASDYILDVDGGTFNVGEVYTRNSFNAQLPIEAIVWSLSSSGTWNTRVWAVRNAGKMIAYNAVFRIPHSIWFEQNTAGQVYIEDCIIDKRGSVGDIQTNHAGTGNNNTTIKNSKFYADGQTGLTFRNAISPAIEGVSVFQARDAWNNESGSPKIIRGLVPETGTNADVSQWAGNTTSVINARKGIQFTWGGHLENSGSNTGQVGVWQELNGNFRLNSGTGVPNAVFYLSDNPIAADAGQTALSNPVTGGTVNTSVSQKYYATTNANGDIPLQTILLGSGSRTTGGLQFAGGNNNRIRSRGKNTTATTDATDDIFDYSVWSYLYLPQTNPLILKATSGAAIYEPVILAPDTSVTLSSTAAAALTGFVINHPGKTITLQANQQKTLCDLYDFAKNNKLNINNIEFPTISTLCATVIGQTIDISNYQLKLEAGSTLLPCSKFEKINSTVASVINDPSINLEVSLTDANGTYKLIRLQNLVSGKVTIKDNITNTILKQVNNYTGDINLTVLSNSTNVSILVERVGFTNWGTNVDLTSGDVFSYVVVQTNGFGDPATLENQNLEIYLMKKLLMKEEAIYNSLNNESSVTLNETFINQTSSLGATVEKQQELIEVLKKILRTHSSNREKLK